MEVIPPIIVAGCFRKVGWNSSLATRASVNSRTNSGPAPSGGSNNDKPPTCMGCSRDSASRNTASVGAISSIRLLDRERRTTRSALRTSPPSRLRDGCARTPPADRRSFGTRVPRYRCRRGRRGNGRSNRRWGARGSRPLRGDPHQTVEPRNVRQGRLRQLSRQRNLDEFPAGCLGQRLRHLVDGERARICQLIGPALGNGEAAQISDRINTPISAPPPLRAIEVFGPHSPRDCGPAGTCIAAGA